MLAPKGIEGYAARVRTSALAFALVVLLSGRGALASPAEEGSPEVSVEASADDQSDEYWYGEPLLLSYLGAGTLTTTILVVSHGDAVGWAFVPFLLPSAVHVWHGETPKGALAFLGQAGFFAGGFLGGCALTLSGDGTLEDCSNAGAAAAAIGYVSWALIDSLALAHTQRSAQSGVGVQLHPSAGGGQVSLSGWF